MQPDRSPRALRRHTPDAARTVTHLGVLLAALAAWLPILGITPHALAAPIASERYVVRVVLGTDNTAASSFLHPAAEAVSPGGLVLLDPSTSAEIGRVEGGVRLRFTAGEGGVWVEALGADLPAALAGPHPSLLLRPATEGATIGVPTLRRPKSTPYPFYRGSLEIKPVGSQLRLINHVAYEDYLRGIVPNEMPVSFAREALKAQAVAARGYTLARLGNYASDADICDSQACQVYYGALTEHPTSNAAVDETLGLVITYRQQVVGAYYASTAGGHTESAHYVWGTGGSFPGTPTPYLTGVPDAGVPEELDLTTEEGVRTFLENGYGDYDRVSPHFRWVEAWTREQLERTIDEQLARRAAADPGAVRPAFRSGDTIGELLGLRAVRRGVSGRIVTLEIRGSQGTWTVDKEYNIRSVLKPANATLLKSALVVFDFTHGEDGKIRGVVARGAGFGHGVGMSQYGAHGMALAGKNFIEILKHYYPGVEVSTQPIFLNPAVLQDPIRQRFVAPSGKGRLLISNLNRDKIEVRINDRVTIRYDFTRAPNTWFEDDVSAYLRTGENVLEIRPVDGATGLATISLAVD